MGDTLKPRRWHLQVAGFVIGWFLSSALLAAALPAQTPTIAFTAPPAGSTVAGSVSLGVNTGGTTACVQYKVDSQILGVAKAAPFGWTWDSRGIADGAHTLTAIAEDAAGVDSLPASRAVTVANGVPPPPPPPPPGDLEAPKVTLTNPAAGASYTTGTLQLFTATASDNVGVASLQFTLDGQALGTAVLAPPYQVPWTTITGPHTVGATARDAAGNFAAANAAITVTAPPVVPTMTVSAITQGNSGNYTLTAQVSQPIGGLTVTMIVTGPSSISRTVSATTSAGGTAIAQVRLKGLARGLYTVQAVTLISGASVTGTATFRY